LFIDGLDIDEIIEASKASWMSTSGRCSGASLEGGGVRSASALSNKDSLALAQLRSQPLMNGLDKIVLVKVFSGIGGGRRAFDLAALHLACFKR
jgi:hypothetical protein